VAYGSVVAIGGTQYTFYAGFAPDEATANSYRERLGRFPAESRLVKAQLKKFTTFGFALPPPIRDAIRNTAPNRVSKPFQIDGRWAIAVRLGQSLEPVPPFERLRDQLPNLVQRGAIPDPEATLKPPLAGLYAASKVHSVEALAQLPPDVDADVVLPDGMTMLQRAVATAQSGLVQALFDRHANPNKCVSGSCPLGIALFAKDPEAMLRLLLEHGARPDAVDPDVGVVMTALAEAMLTAKALELGEILIAKGANVDGDPGEFPPVTIAAEKGNRAAIEMLLRHGADLFRYAQVQLPRNALTSASVAKTAPEFQTWLRQEWAQAAKNSGLFDWQAWIEQGGKRTPIADKPIVIKREPFDIVVRMRTGLRLMVAASDDHQLLDDYKTELAPGPLHSIASVVADDCDGPQRPLFLSGKSKTGKIDGNRVMGWKDDASCHNFTSVTPDGNAMRYVRSIDRLETYDGGHSVAEGDARSLFVVMGTEVDTVFPSFDYFAPKQFELRFR
jgi:ankyrin repeat protein